MLTAAASGFPPLGVGIHRWRSQTLTSYQLTGRSSREGGKWGKRDPECLRAERHLEVTVRCGSRDCAPACIPALPNSSQFQHYGQKILLFHVRFSAVGCISHPIPFFFCYKYRAVPSKRDHSRCSQPHSTQTWCQAPKPRPGTGGSLGRVGGDAGAENPSCNPRPGFSACRNSPVTHPRLGIALVPPPAHLPHRRGCRVCKLMFKYRPYFLPFPRKIKQPRVCLKAAAGGGRALGPGVLGSVGERCGGAGRGGAVLCLLPARSRWAQDLLPFPNSKQRAWHSRQLPAGLWM